MIDQELDPSVEVVYLRRLLDIQPGCLLRLGEDGTVLAANDAALMLLGAKSHADVLARNLASWFPPDQRDRWRAFTIGVVQGVPASIECDITAPPGDLHPTLFHAVPLADHPDGAVSMAVTARAISTQRRLEAAIVQHEDRIRELDAARRAAELKCTRALSDVRQLEMALEEFAARHQKVTAEPDRLTAGIEDREATVRALERALRELETAHRDLAVAHEAATAEYDLLVNAVRGEAMRLAALADGAPRPGDGSGAVWESASPLVSPEEPRT